MCRHSLRSCFANPELRIRAPANGGTAVFGSLRVVECLGTTDAIWYRSLCICLLYFFERKSPTRFLRDIWPVPARILPEYGGRPFSSTSLSFLLATWFLVLRGSCAQGWACLHWFSWAALLHLPGVVAQRPFCQAILDSPQTLSTFRKRLGSLSSQFPHLFALYAVI